ncbi:hypothetical protein AURDEDRAFT_162177 [Auricularia subglabra TFB-10046 SS5]|nr:hypothetical protein AURDEDRAFT_162177 [Auricularia subglabra TFB-10046 SS5]
MPSIMTTPGADPMLVTYHSVPVHRGSLQFLNCSIDDNKATFDTINDIIVNFSFPRMALRLPITLIRKIIEQKIISRVRPRLALQPLERSQAGSLDKAICTLVHRWSRFLYHPNSSVLNLPIPLHGLGFTSIERLNDASAVEGLARDLNHPIEVYRTMARMTLADWTCGYNSCHNPFGSQGPDASWVRKGGLIPRAFLTAHEAMSTLSPRLYLRHTDQSFLLNGDTHIKHVAALAGRFIAGMPSGKAWMSLKSHGLTALKDFGSWIADDRRAIFQTHGPNKVTHFSR